MEANGSGIATSSYAVARLTYSKESYSQGRRDSEWSPVVSLQASSVEELPEITRAARKNWLKSVFVMAIS